MPFTPGWNPDKQARVARLANDQGHLDGPLPLISFGSTPSVVEFDWTNPSSARLGYQARVAVTAQQQVQGFNAGTMPAPPAPVGAQSADLAPRAAARARDYSLAAAFPLELIGQDSVNPGARSIDLPPRGALRARDYNIAAAYTLELIGQDNLPAGGQLSGPAPAGARRASTLSETGSNQTVELTSAPPVIPCGQSTDGSALPPRAAARARDYSLTASFPLELINRDQFYGTPGQAQNFDWQNPRAALRTYALYDPGYNLTLQLPAPTVTLPPGTQATDTLPPHAPARAREYGQGSAFPLELRGRDQVYSAAGEVPAYDWPNPRAPQRLRDYSWLQSLPLHIYFPSLPPGQSTGSTERPPRGPQRLPDYTFTAAVRLQLIGQDRMYGAPGQVPAYDWQLPTPRPARMRDYTWVQSAPYGSGTVVVERDLSYLVGTPQARWSAGGPIQDRWKAAGVASSS